MVTLNANDALYQDELMDLFDGLHTALQYRALSSGGLTIGTGSAAKIKIANTVTYLNAGIFKSKTTAEVAFTATSHDIAANASAVQEACYVVCLAADGTPSITMGAVASGSGNAKLPDYDDLPSGETPIGYLRLAVAAGATPFDASTDSLSAGHLTDTYVDLGFLYPRFDTVQ